MKALNGVLFGEDKTSGVMNLELFLFRYCAVWRFVSDLPSSPRSAIKIDQLHLPASFEVKMRAVRIAYELCSMRFDPKGCKGT